MNSSSSNALVEVDSLIIQAIVNDEIDQISPSPHPGMRMDTFCCGAHGLSLLITAIKAGRPSRSLLFDAGPEGEVWERNAQRLGLDVGAIEHVVLSHWHRDHSGGLVSAVRMISEAAATAKKVTTTSSAVVVDVHPDRPAFRGVMIPEPQEPISLQADPTVRELLDAGAAVRSEDGVHTVLDDMFLVSGEIPREADYEGGIRGGITFNESSGKWEQDEPIMDERDAGTYGSYLWWDEIRTHLRY
ncbi:hypothetical protein PG997_002905 [Apiospora hydei]|uniref:Metallo-beta-lactamase domain-containing protein n=1 Tax=Apiospora hydei TaxID=1337664 RepID=A0ABR1WXR1_9PEZI